MKNKEEILKETLVNIKKELEYLGVEYFLCAAYPNTDIGASIYNGRGLEDGAAANARKAHIKWEKKHNIDPNHDWGKE